MHLELGFASLFAYCVQSLQMSEGAAGRRVAAARVGRLHPQAFDWVARGELHLSALCALAPHLDPHNADELFSACRGKTRRQIDQLLAARFPAPDVKEQIRRLPSRDQGAKRLVETSSAGGTGLATLVLPVSTAEHATPASSSTDNRPENLGCSAVRVQPAELGRPAPGVVRRSHELEALSAEHYGVHFTADAELRDLIERARAIASHRLPRGNLSAVMKLVFKQFVTREQKRRFGIGCRPRDCTPSKCTPSHHQISKFTEGGQFLLGSWAHRIGSSIERQLPEWAHGEVIVARKCPEFSATHSTELP